MPLCLHDHSELEKPREADLLTGINLKGVSLVQWCWGFGYPKADTCMRQNRTDFPKASTSALRKPSSYSLPRYQIRTRQRVGGYVCKGI